MTNLFKQEDLPRFDDIDIQKIEPTISKLLNENRNQISQLLDQPGSPSWDNLMKPLEAMTDSFHKTWSPVSHLHAVMENEELRKAYSASLSLITDYQTELAQNEQLFKAFTSITESNEFTKLDASARKVLENDIRDFKLAGVHLLPEEKSRVADLHLELNQLMTKFSENLLDATHAWTLHITDEKLIKGLPEQALHLAITNAKKRNLEGYVFTLDYPSFSTAVKFLDNRKLRQQIYEAFVTRASDTGPNALKWDNTPIMYKILKCRHELAKLIGYENYAEYSLATKMAKTTREVLSFLHDLLIRSKPIAEEECEELRGLAAQDGIERLEAWDTPYYSEKLSKAIFNFTQEDLRPYFPIGKVMQGMFTLVEKIYGITIKESNEIVTWNDQAKFFSVYDEKQHLRGGFYIDLYARPHKRDGAWMDECRTRRLLNDNHIQHPVAYLTCNFMPPIGNQPALLTHDDVLTLFHEFGHVLHHILSTVNYPSVSGINGVPWDAVEFPSQMMENFCWEKVPLKLISGHYQTGEPLPQDLFQKMLNSKHFQTGLQMLRQIEFALFDFRLHCEYDESQTNFIKNMLNQVRSETAIIPVPDFNRFENSFSHVFGGAYAAGYYSYKWAEVLSSDAYAEFEEKGILDRETGRSFMENILEVGGVRSPLDSFTVFRGRPPKIDALLRLSGITKGGTASGLSD